jgi:hypothetical protein
MKPVYEHSAGPPKKPLRLEGQRGVRSLGEGNRSSSPHTPSTRSSSPHASLRDSSTVPSYRSRQVVRSPPPTPKRARSESLPPPDEPAKQPKFRNNTTPRGRAKASDYDPTVERMILQACYFYDCRIWVENAFPDASTQAEWVVDIWEEVCKVAGEVYALTDRIITIVCILFF